MGKKRLTSIATALVLITLLSLSITPVVMAADGGVKQVTVSVTDAEINPGDTDNITITVVTGSSIDAWTGTITVTDPGTGTHIKAISGTGTVSVSNIFPGTFSNSPDTDTVGTYSISVTANIAGQTAVNGTGSFAVKTWYLTLSSYSIVKNGTLTITVNTADTDWGGDITITEPTGGGSQSATYDFGSGLSGDQTTTVFPGGAGWTGAADTASAGVYSISFDEDGTPSADDETFDVQDANPHVGNFGATTYACAGCHRTHVEVSGAKLLKGSTQLGLCNSCHDGTGANTNIISGIYLGNTEGTQNAGLRGGGFTNASMDSDLDGTVSSMPVTSKHTAGATNPRAWGSGALGSNDAGEVMSSLECGNCHNPHGNSQYRILRPQPTGLVADAPTSDVTILASLETTKNYTISYDTNYYRDMGAYPTGVLSKMTEWCGQCHERYEAGAGAGSNPRGDTVFLYSHMTEGLGGECLKCHVAHGTSATMGGNSASPTITWPANTPPTWQGSESNYSRLLHINNRGVCIQCHDTADLTSN
ncbi:MAG: hypothetical protein JSW16_04105 [Dehalococcoidales bacterium]|nr:MAG: hypothetical protein JSW16_04105 [Dehalococcoidales bacterium]